MEELESLIKMKLWAFTTTLAELEQMIDSVPTEQGLPFILDFGRRAIDSGLGGSLIEEIIGS